MGKGRYVKCWKCGWSQERLPPRDGKPQRCGCGHILDGSKPTTSLRPPSLPSRSSNASQGSSSQRNSQRVNRYGKSLGSRGSRNGNGNGNGNGSMPPPPPAGTEMDASEPSQLSERERHSSLITKYESLVESLDAVTDSELISSLQSKIALSKSAIIRAKPLEQQISSLEPYLDRKSQKILECQRVIIETHQTLLDTQEDLALRKSELASLKQQRLTEIAGAPVRVGPPDLANLSLAAQLQQMQQLVATLATSLAPMDSLPPQARALLNAFASQSQVTGTAAESPPLSAPLAPASPPAAHTVSGTEPSPAELASSILQSDSYGPVLEATDARFAPFAATKSVAMASDVSPVVTDQQKVDSIMASLPSPARAPTSPRSDFPSPPSKKDEG